MRLRKKKRWLSVGLAFVLLCGILGYRIYDTVAANKARAEKLAGGGAVAVEVAPLSRRDMTPVITFSANLEPEWSADVSAKIDGRIEELYVNEGDWVEAGTVLAVLDTNELQGQAMQAQGNLMAAQSNLEQAQLEYSRYNALAGQGAVAAQVLDNARTKRDSAAGQVKAAKGAVRLIEEKLANAKVKAPRAGLITKRHLQAGTFARSGSPLFTIADTNTLLAKATVGESQAAGILAGTEVEVRVGALEGRTFSGRVTRVSPVAELPARTFTADIAIPNGDGVLKAGMFAKAAIPTATRRQVLAAPESAFVMREDQRSLFVVTADNKAAQRIVKTGFSSGGWTEVLEGVEEGERIVVGGQNKVRDGGGVTPIEGGV